MNFVASNAGVALTHQKRRPIIAPLFTGKRSLSWHITRVALAANVAQRHNRSNYSSPLFSDHIEVRQPWGEAPTLSFRAAPDIKEQVRQAIDLVELVGDYLPLRREGSQFKALCPWHPDRRPSLTVNPARQSWKCWVCDIGGDMFSFVQRMERLEFPEAVRFLAERAGIALEPVRSRAGDAAANPANQKQNLFQAMAWAEREYHDYLMQAPGAEAARQYLQERGVTEESLHRFHIGYAPEQGTWLLGRARSQGVSPEVLEAVDLIGRRNEGEGHFDRFRGRVLFSIRDPQGRAVGMGGRILPGSSHPAKYLNTRETALFSKSSLLYGLDLARDQIAKQGSVLVMEGYTDCIVAHQQGFPHAVAVLGTALGDRHIRLLQRYTDRVVLVLDGDEAGQRRTNEVLELFIRQQVDLRILSLTSGLDPCDFLLSHGATAFARLEAEAIDAVEHAYRAVAAGLDASSSVHNTQQAIERILATLAQAPRLDLATTSAARLKEEQIVHRLARKSGVPEETLRGRLATLRREGNRSRPAEVPAAEPVASLRLDSWEQELFEILSLAPNLWHEISDLLTPEKFSTDAARGLYAACVTLAADGDDPSFERLLDHFDAPEQKSLLVRLDDAAHEKQSADTRERLQSLLDRLDSQREALQRQAQATALKQQQCAAEDEAHILERLLQQRRQRLGISSPTDG
jgi:DNA primase